MEVRCGGEQAAPSRRSCPGEAGPGRAVPAPGRGQPAAPGRSSAGTGSCRVRGRRAEQGSRGRSPSPPSPPDPRPPRSEPLALRGQARGFTATSLGT